MEHSQPSIRAPLAAFTGPGDPLAYLYRGAPWCSTCIFVQIVGEDRCDAVTIPDLPTYTLESLLDDLARLTGVERGSANQEDFPIPWRDVGAGDARFHCSQCGQEVRG